MLPLGPTLLEMAAAWWAEASTSGWLVALAGAVGGLLLWRYRPRLALPLVLPSALAIGLWFAWGQLSLVDDAFVTLRYADHWTSGVGPVWNPDERVEGITNFGWLAVLSLLHLVTRLPLEYAVLLMCATAYVGLVGATFALERSLDPERRAVPLASALVGVQYTVTAYASSGLETEAAAALVVAGAVAAWRREDAVGAGVAGACWVGAGLLRMDHLLAFVVGVGWLGLRHRRFLTSAADRTALAALFSPLLPWAALHGWKLSFYGSILPNTYYAKSAGGWYPSQGLVYAVEFYAASNLWLAAVPAVAWPFLAKGRERWIAAYGAGFVLLWHLYVLKVGGDFMAGRFFVPVVPWLLVGAVRTAAVLAGDRPHLGLAAVAIVAATVRGGSLLPPRRVRWGLTDECTYYQVTKVRPALAIRHPSFRDGHELHRLLTARGLRPVVATSGIGMVGFYSKLEVVDVLGLTDPVIARSPLASRGRPGHEKAPPPGYLEERDVDIVRSDILRVPYASPLVVDLRRLALPKSGGRWSIYRFDPELWEQVAEVSPEVRYERFAPYVLSDVLPSVASMTRAEADQLLRELDEYYWDRNGRDPLRAQVVALIEQR